MRPSVIHVVHRVVINIGDFAASIHHRVRTRTFRQCHILSAIRDGGHRVVQRLGHTMHVLGIVRRRIELTRSQRIGVCPDRIMTCAVRIGVTEHHCTRSVSAKVSCTICKRDCNRMTTHIRDFRRSRTMHVRDTGHFFSACCRNGSYGFRQADMVCVRPFLDVVRAVRVRIGVRHIALARNRAQVCRSHYWTGRGQRGSTSIRHHWQQTGIGLNGL